MHAPPGVSEHVEDGKHDDKEDASPFGFEADCDEDAGGETKDRNEDTGKAPRALEDESDEEENEEHASRQLEVFTPVAFADGGQSGKGGFFVGHGVGEDHEETTDDGEIAEEEVEVEDETVAETLEDDDSKESKDGVF